MKSMITTQRVSFGPTLLTKDRMNQLFLNTMSHDMAALLILVKDILLNYGHKLCNNGLLAPWSAVLLI